MKTILKITLPNLLSAIGGIAVVAGELDDSPGLSGLGLINIGIAIYLNFKFIKN